ncbi:unnamed protein product [Nezara viridula]|uniref:Uncharacterized protein n=1 Tax=Nezara viridula TaxID=85310 RepID=A0A9P0E388_NEZVI|nr:unnamed protein product [Nezara viridula]
MFSYKEEIIQQQQQEMEN